MKQARSGNSSFNPYTRVFLILLVFLNIGATLLWSDKARRMVGLERPSRQEAGQLHADFVLPQELRARFPWSDDRPYLMALFVGSDTRKHRLRYFETLRRRLDGRNAAFVAVTPGSLPALSDAIESGHFHWPLVVDRDLSLHRALDIGADHGHGGLVVFNRGWSVEYRSLEVPDSDNARQLGEKYAVGAIKYDYQADRIEDHLRTGSVIPDWQITDLAKDTPVRAIDALAGRTVVIFGAPCAQCQLGKVLEEIRRLPNAFSSGQAAPALLFSDNFDADLLISMRKSRALPPNVFMVSAASIGTDGYYTRSSELRPLLVRLDPSARVTSSARMDF